MRYIIYGAGGIGSGIGGHLHRHGYETLLVGRPGHIGRIRESGLRLITGEQTYVIDVPAVTSASEIDFRPEDRILLCVKSQDTETALREIRAAGADTERLPIFCCQNSIVNEGYAIRYFANVYGVMVRVPGIYLEDGVVFNPITGNAGVLEVGRFPNGLDATAEEVSAALRHAGYASPTNTNVMRVKATKFLDNLGNALGAITDGKGDRAAYMREVRREGETVLRAAGIDWEPAEEYNARMHDMRGTTTLPEGMRNLGSTWQSLQRGQGSVETDYLNGEVVRLGRIHGIPVPHNALLQRLANEMARNHERPGRYTADDLAQMAK